MREEKLRFDHVILGLLSGVAISYILLLSANVHIASALMLMVFNFLFATIVFPLEGAISRKLFLLVVGNAVGFVWNLTFSWFADAAVSLFGEAFNTVYVILSPFANLVWIVAFWSLSLSFLAGSRVTAVKV